METESIKLDVHVIAWSHTRSSGFLSTVIISIAREFEEFVVNGNDDTVTSLGSDRDPSRPDKLVFLKLRDFEPNYLHQLLHNNLHDHVLSQQIGDQIVVQAQRQRSQSSDLPQQQQPLFIIVSVKLTQKGYSFVPYNSVDNRFGPRERRRIGDLCHQIGESVRDPRINPFAMSGLNLHDNSCPLCGKEQQSETESN